MALVAKRDVWLDWGSFGGGRVSGKVSCGQGSVAGSTRRQRGFKSASSNALCLF